MCHCLTLHASEFSHYQMQTVQKSVDNKDPNILGFYLASEVRWIPLLFLKCCYIYMINQCIPSSVKEIKFLCNFIALRLSEFEIILLYIFTCTIARIKSTRITLLVIGST
ncbi:unnamed protein product [Ilex paraguariensis]|uniref:Uncharacterized protein n=1 Tax=Ilex paraguariensis TaxID=185542 RepID=A0ABC8TUU0_9AQUA